MIREAFFGDSSSWHPLPVFSHRHNGIISNAGSYNVLVYTVLCTAPVYSSEFFYVNKIARSTTKNSKKSNYFDLKTTPCYKRVRGIAE